MKNNSIVDKTGEIILNSETKQDKLDMFEDKLKKGYWLVRLHASWCSHCINMIDEWKMFLKECKEKNCFSSFNVVSVESKIQPQLKNEFLMNCDGYPTIFLMKNGKIVSHFENRERNSKNFLEFMEEHTHFLTNKKLIKEEKKIKKSNKKKSKQNTKSKKNSKDSKK